MYRFSVSFVIFVALYCTLFFLIDFKVSTEDLSKAISFLASVSASIFTVGGIWVAVIYPKYLDVLGGKSNRWIYMFEGVPESLTGSVALLFRSIFYALLVLILSISLNFFMSFFDFFSNSYFLFFLMSLCLFMYVCQVSACYFVLECIVLIIYGGEVEREVDHNDI